MNNVSRLKIMAGYALLLALLAFALLFLRREMENLTLSEDRDTQWTDSLIGLLHEKDSLTISMLRELGKIRSDLLSPSDIRRLTDIVQDTALAARKVVQHRVVRHRDTVVTHTEKKGFFRRLGEVFAPPKADTAIQVKTSTEFNVDTVVEVYNPMDSIRQHLQAVAQRRKEDSIALQRRNRRLRKLDRQISARIDSLVKGYERHTLERTRQEAAIRQETRRRSAHTIGGIAAGAVVLAAVFLLVIGRDVARSNRYRRQLEEARRRAEALLATREKLMLAITHDFKAPLGSIMGYADLLSRLTVDERQRFYLDNMKQSSQHLLRLVTDLLDRSNPLVYSPKESVTAELTSSQDGKYLIVGNPFMAPLDLQKFFDGNTHLQPKYWTETKDGPAVGSADDESQWIETIEGATIPPYGAFFVEKAEGATGNTVSFTADMQTFGTATGETTGTNSLVVTAENASGRSRAALAYAYAATDGYRAEEDAQLIADLTGDGTAAPVVYTVAGDVAASVNRLHAQRQVPLGLFAAEEAQTLLTFSGVSALRNPRLYDAVAGTETPLAEGYTLTLAGASHGRYFLRSDGSTATGIGDEQGGDEARLTAYSVRRGEVIVSADVPLRTVQVYSVGGLLLDGSEPSADASVCRFDGLPSGVAVVRATMADGRTTAVKVAVQ